MGNMYISELTGISFFLVHQAVVLFPLEYSAIPLVLSLFSTVESLVADSSNVVVSISLRCNSVRNVAHILQLKIRYLNNLCNMRNESI